MSSSLPPRPPFRTAAALIATFAVLALVAPFLATLTGCKNEPDPIVTYTISTKVPEQLLAGKDRMLAVMLPKGDDVWFFKVTGPEKPIAEIESRFRQFVSAISFADDGPDLKRLPDRWNRSGDRPMRFASINIDTTSKQLDLSISKLTLQEDWETQVKMNVNRWRGQLGLEPSDDKWAEAEEIEVASADAPGVWVDLIGETSAASSMSPPFAQGRGAMPPDHPPIAPRQTESPRPSSPSPASTGSPPTDSRLKYDRPEGWRDGRMRSMRMAAFNVGPEDSPAEITVIPAGGDLKGNVKRWMGQVRKEEVSDEDVDQAMADAAKVEVSGLEGHRYILVGDKETIDATIVPLDGGMSLFIKMKGPAKTVAEESEAIDAFLKSIQLNL